MLSAIFANWPVLWTWAATVLVVHAVQYGLGLGQPSLGLALSSSAIPALSVALANLRHRRSAMATVTAGVAVLAVANAAYWRFFQRFIPLESFVAAGNGIRHRTYLSGLLRASDALPVIIALVTVVFAVVGLRSARFRGAGSEQTGPRLARRTLYALPISICLLGAIPSLRWAWVVSPGDHDAGSGGFIYSELSDARRMIGDWMIPADPTDAEWKRVLGTTVGRTTVGRDTARRDRAAADLFNGIVAGSNILMVKIEGMNGWLPGLDVNGQAVMPYTRSLAARGIAFANFYDATREGRSSDADYLIMASQHPLEHGAVSLVRPNLEMTALPKLLAARGYTTFSADAGSPVSWNAALRHRKYGFSTSRFGPDFASTTRLGFGLPDSVFFSRTAPLLAALHSPWLAWLHTVTMHGPHHEFPDSLRTLSIGALNETPFGTYLQKAHYTDHTLRDLLAALDSAGVLANTTIVIYGDHTESFGFNAGDVARVTGIATLPDGARNPEMEKIPLIIVPAARVSHTRAIAGAQRPASVGGLIDLGPTLLHLLGLPQPSSMLGRSLLPDSPGFAASASGTVAGEDRYWTGHDCYALPSGAKMEASHCASIADAAREQLGVSWLITRYGLSQRIDSVRRR